MISKINQLSAIVCLCLMAWFFLAVSGPRAVKLDESQFLVITVQGKIIFEDSKAEMKQGDIYVNGMPLNFVTNTSRAAVANKFSGRFVITANKKNDVNMLPASNPISSRAGGIINLVDLKRHFEGRLMFIEEGRVHIGASAFPQSEKTYFFVKYEHHGEQIPKKLGFEGESLIINKYELFKVDGSAIPVEEKLMTLFYKDSDKSYKITTFTPVFPDPQVLKTELTLLFQTTEADSEGKRLAAAESYALDWYGKPDRANLSAWLEKEFN